MKKTLKEIPEDNKGLSKLPEDARNKMGFKKYGGKITYRMGGGKVVSVGYDDQSQFYQTADYEARKEKEKTK